MTDAQLAEMERALEKRLKPWLSKAHMLILSCMEDAHAHAELAVTRSLKATPDGRDSARRIDQSPSYQAAIRHLNGLLDRLVGPKSNSLDGLIRDARASFYRDSVALWKPYIEPEYRATPDPVPTQAGEALMRGAVVHGYDLRAEVAPAIEATKRELLAALSQAGRKAATDRDGQAWLAVWHNQGRDRIRAKAFQALNDSDKAVHEATGILLLAPQYRGELIAVAGDGGLHLPG